MDQTTAAAPTGVEVPLTEEGLCTDLALMGDGFTPAHADEVKVFMVTCGATEEMAADIAVKLKEGLTITSIAQYGSWFGTWSLRDWFAAHTEWANDAPRFVVLNWALQTRKRMDTAKAKAAETIDEDEKKPMDPVTNQSLDAQWKQLYTVPLPGSQEFTSQILNNLYRQLKTDRAKLNQLRAYTRRTTSQV